MAKRTSKSLGEHFLRGEIRWAKVLGDPVDNYQGDGKEWTFDLVLDESSLSKIEELGYEHLKDLKDENDTVKRKGCVLRMKKKFNPDHPYPIKVVDKDGKSWNDEALIGNGSLVDVKIEAISFGKMMGLYPRAIRVNKHVAYEAKDPFADFDEDDVEAPVDTLGDDDLPF